MELKDRNSFLAKSAETLAGIYDTLSDLPKLSMDGFENKKIALVIIDMINGFTREGALKSSRVEGLIPEIVKLSKKCDIYDIVKLAFADCHTEDSPEFDAYPMHCMVGSHEGEVVDEIKDVGGYLLIPKNSTNGFLEKGFQDWFSKNQHSDTFIITGCCTDICIQQFAITLKTWFNMHNKKSRVIVPLNAVETFDLGLHDGDLIHVMALFNMITNGIELVSEIV